MVVLLVPLVGLLAVYAVHSEWGGGDWLAAGVGVTAALLTLGML